MGSGRNNFSGVVGGWVMGSVVFLVVVAITIFLVMVFFFFFFFFNKVVLVDVDLCQWWLSALLQRRWLCRCC